MDDSNEEIWIDENGVSNTINISFSDIQGGSDGIVTKGNGIVNWLDGNGDGIAIVDMGAYEYGSLPVGYESYQLQTTRFMLQVYPNPTRGISDIRYQIQDIRFVSLEIFDVHGQKIRTLVSRQQKPGEYIVQFDGSGLPAGIYLVRLETGDTVKTAKILLIK